MEENSGEAASSDDRPRNPLHPNLLAGGSPGQFTSDQSHLTEAKKAGWLKKKRGAKLVREMFATKYNVDEQTRKDIARYFEVDDDEITIEMLMVFKQVQIAIQYGDSNAYKILKEEAYGKPKEFHEIHNTDGSAGGKPQLIMNPIALIEPGQADKLLAPPISEDDNDSETPVININQENSTI